MYIFQLMDTYSASGISLLWVCFFQTIAISWFFGADRFRECINQMLGFRPNLFWYICWVYLSPFVMIVRFNYFLFEKSDNITMLNSKNSNSNLIFYRWYLYFLSSSMNRLCMEIIIHIHGGEKD